MIQIGIFQEMRGKPNHYRFSTEVLRDEMELKLSQSSEIAFSKAEREKKAIQCEQRYGNKTTVHICS